jgi:hypothetical protein
MVSIQGTTVEGTNSQHTGNNCTGNKWSAYREQNFREKVAWTKFAVKNIGKNRKKQFYSLHTVSLLLLQIFSPNGLYTMCSILM